ncbi:hypothetical protein ALC53_01596 [Atta colombica]|uniref:Uncharacterized protein n=1 Tax=Atta colombica TaxID=520822 RepID=A0A195BU87_9HYME|nr:hypothetical protein ALC53_01596 [Atta colombica]
MPVVCAPVIKFTVVPGPSTGQSSLQNSNLITPAFESGTKDGGEKERQSFHLSHHNWSAQTVKSLSLDFGNGRSSSTFVLTASVDIKNRFKYYPRTMGTIRKFVMREDGSPSTICRAKLQFPVNSATLSVTLLSQRLLTGRRERRANRAKDEATS